jgi:predicted nucleic acid-binding protein
VAMKQLLDTNIVLYFLAGTLKDPLADNEYCVSVITQLELLSYHAIDREGQSSIDEFLQQVEIININSEIVQKTIEIRKKYRFKLPDSIVIATAKVLDVEMLSNDRQFTKFPELNCKDLAIAEVICS